MNALRGLASRILEPLGTRVVRVLTGPLAGARMELVLAREKAYWSGTYERGTQRALRRLARMDGTAWDVGAHIGFFSLLLARRSARVVAVEAAGENAARLARNVALNAARVEIVHAAVTGSAGVVRVASHAESAMHKIGETGDEVEAVTLDVLLDRFGPPALVKLDVEGAEADALAASPRLLAAHPAIVVEMHGEGVRQSVLATLRAAGYAVELPSPWRAVAT